MKNNEAGFTLIESMMVLSIFLLIVSLSLFFLKPHYQFEEKERFITLFTSDILYAQQYAISQQVRLLVDLESNGNQYYVSERITGDTILERSIPDSIKIERGTLGKRSLSFEILPDGGVSDFGTFFFIVGEVRYKVVFQIGAGRFYIVKE